MPPPRRGPAAGAFRPSIQPYKVQMPVGDTVLLRRILIQGWRFRWMILLSLTASAINGGLLTLLLAKLGPFMALFQRNPDPAALADTARGVGDLGWLLINLSPLALAAAYLAWWAGQRVANLAMRSLRDRVLGHLVRLDLSYHSELSRGEMLTRLTSDLSGVLKVQQHLYGRLLQRPLEIIGFITMACWLDWRLGLGLCVVLVPVIIGVIPLVKRTRRRSNQARDTLAANLGVLEQITAGIRVVKAMGSAEREALRYQAHNHQLFSANMRLVRARAVSDGVTAAAIFVLAGGAMLLGAWLFGRSLVASDTLIVAIGCLGLTITRLRETVRVWGDLQEHLPCAARVFAVLDRPATITEVPNAHPAAAPQRGITLEGVRFRYRSDGDEVLRGVDLSIPSGKTVALVGESGAGKTTILDLIPRFHDVTGGRIAIDGTDVRALQLSSLAGLFAIVGQDSFLFDDTILANIRYGRPEATIAEVEQAARRAHVHEAILALEGGQGYATQVGDRGGRLSGGQRQRIAIARALLRDAPILLLDEPTSALDADSERHVQLALTELMKGRTVIVVAHRLATVQHADLIYVLGGKDHARRGQVLEQGTHASLVAADGDYARLVRLQQLE